MLSENEGQNQTVTPEEIGSLRKKAAMVDQAMQCVKDSSLEIEKMKSEKDQLSERVREPFIKSLAKDSKGFFAEEDLKRLPIEVLLEMRKTFDGEVRAIFDDWMSSREMKEAERNRRTHSTVGSYNQETGKYEGGDT